MLAYIKCLGPQKSVLSLEQRTTFLGDSMGFDHDAGTSVHYTYSFDPNHSERHQAFMLMSLWKSSSGGRVTAKQ